MCMCVNVWWPKDIRGHPQDTTHSGRWGPTPLILALGRQRQVDLYEFEVSLVYRQAPKLQRNPVSKKQKQKTNKQKTHTHKKKRKKEKLSGNSEASP